MAKYRKKPVVIEAIQYTKSCLAEAICFMPKDKFVPYLMRDGVLFIHIIHTLEGDMTVSEGDWIIKGINGEFYPCKDDIFQKTYEKVDE